VGKLDLGRRPVTVLVAVLVALTVAGCNSAPGSGAARRPAAATAQRTARPAGAVAASGYLHAGRSSVAYLQWSAAGRADLTGTLRLTVISGTAPRQVLAAHSYPFSGRVRRGRVLTIRIGGVTARGILSGSTTPGRTARGRATPGGHTPRAHLTLGPLPDSGLTRTFRAATADNYSRAVAALRDRARRSDALASQLAASAARRRQQAARAVARLVTAALAVQQARRVVSGQLRGMRDETALAAVALGKARRDAGEGLARARVGARRVLVCDYAVAVDSDAQGVSAYSTGMASDAASLSDNVTALRAAIADLSAQLRVVLRRQPGYSGGGLAPSPDLVRSKISRGTRRIGAALAEANGYVDQLNLYVASAYRLSARTAAARTCRSASPAPAPLARIPQTP
jgi:predicted small secreted protein